MPLLEYRCADCGSVFERLVQRTEGAGSAACPDCGQPNGKRLLSVFAVKGGDGAATSEAACAMPGMAPGMGMGGCGAGCGCGH
jgi:putative FmdB family regulatory protein